MIKSPIDNIRKYTDKEQILRYLPLEEACEIKAEYFEYNPYCMIRSSKEKAVLTHDVEHGESLTIKQCSKDGTTIATIPLDETIKEMCLECTSSWKELWINYENGNQFHVIVYRRS